MRGWASGLEPMTTETRWSRTWSHLGILTSITALVIYVTWRIVFTLPPVGWNLLAAWLLIAFEAFPVIGLIIRAVTLWNLDTRVPAPVTTVSPGHRAAVFIPTYNEPVEVIAPTIAAACALEPAHQTWVLDDGDRPWVAELCEELGARYVRRPEHTHAKAGNMNHALELMAREIDEGAEAVDVIAVLDCDHVPLPRFLTATLGWFDDPGVALVQAPQTYYNSGAFDDDGDTGEQGMFFHVLLPARNHDGAGPFWCGSTSLIRLTALQEVGGISTATIVEDMHTTLGLIRAGWKTAYHHQVLALGLAPETPEQYLLQRRRWGMGSMQVLVRERSGPPSGGCPGATSTSTSAAPCGGSKAWAPSSPSSSRRPSWSAAPRSPPHRRRSSRWSSPSCSPSASGARASSTASTCTGRPPSRSGSSGSPSDSPACGG